MPRHLADTLPATLVDTVADLASGLMADTLDLVLGRACLDCDELGRALCEACLGLLRHRTVDAPGPLGLPTAAALPYEPDGRRLVLAYKEQGLRSLGPSLGVLLADAVTSLADRLGAHRLVLVPVPAHRWSRRGFDAVGGIVRPAARDLRSRGLVVDVERTVAARAYQPLKDLGREARATAIAGAFRLRSSHRADHAPRVIVDDVITTGATTGEVAGLLAASGLRVAGIAAVTAVSPDRPASSPAPAPPTPRH